MVADVVVVSDDEVVVADVVVVSDDVVVVEVVVVVSPVVVVVVVSVTRILLTSTDTELASAAFMPPKSTTPVISL